MTTRGSTGWNASSASSRIGCTPRDADEGGPLGRQVHRPSIRRRWIRTLAAKLAILRRYRGIQRSPLASLRYLLFSRELDNFTYDLANEAEMAATLGEFLKVSSATVLGYMRELAEDGDLAQRLASKLDRRPDRNRSMPFGRRLGWYAIVRVRKPRMIVETGVHDGLGSVALLRALERNAAEGRSGVLLSFDIREDVGWLIPEELRIRHELCLGDALRLMPQELGSRRVDLFIHDSDHRYEHESAEFEVVRQLTNAGAVLISDNAHGGRAFRDFCDRWGLRYEFAPEVPRDHFYPGAGIGLTTMPEGGVG